MVLEEAESVLLHKLTEIPFWACRIQNKIVCFLPQTLHYITQWTAILKTLTMIL